MKISVQSYLILKAIKESPRGTYGFEIIKKFEIKSGTLYPILKRLVTEGLVTKRKENSDPRLLGRPLRKLYKLTRAGSKQFKKWEEVLGTSSK